VTGHDLPLQKNGKCDIITRREVKNVMIQKLIIDTENEHKLKALYQECGKHDGFFAKMYWNIIRARINPGEDDLFFIENEKLLAYLGVFVFKRDEAEITGIVLPEKRRQKIFKTMLREGLQGLSTRNVPFCVLVCPEKATPVISMVKKYQGVYHHSECEMKLTGSHPTYNKELITLRPAEKNDLNLLIHIHKLSFNSTFESAFAQVNPSFEEGGRRFTWIAYNQAGIPVGKIHARIDPEGVYLHDIGVIPQFRNQKYGQIIVCQVLDFLKQEGHKDIMLDIISDNIAALVLYKKCGFEIIASFQFWKFMVSELLAKLNQ
jgi:ribosomal protein S18 acetylase RimI-like enzyme